MLYHYAAARLAVDHAERRLEHSLAAFFQSLDMPTGGHTPLAASLSTRLAQLRSGALPETPRIQAADEPRRDLMVQKAA